MDYLAELNEYILQLIDENLEEKYLTEWDDEEFYIEYYNGYIENEICEFCRKRNRDFCVYQKCEMYRKNKYDEEKINIEKYTEIFNLKKYKLEYGDFFYDKFGDNGHYEKFYKLHGEPTAKQYFELMRDIRDTQFDDFNYLLDEDEFESCMEKIIRIKAIDLADDFNTFNTEKLINKIEELEQSIITIQRAFRKYRYTPCYKFCKLVQTRNLMLGKSISEEDFEKYLKDNKIIR